MSLEGEESILVREKSVEHFEMQTHEKAFSTAHFEPHDLLS